MFEYQFIHYPRRNVADYYWRARCDWCVQIVLIPTDNICEDRGDGWFVEFNCENPLNREKEILIHLKNLKYVYGVKQDFNTNSDPKLMGINCVNEKRSLVCHSCIKSEFTF